MEEIPGLIYIKDFISDSEHNDYIDFLQSEDTKWKHVGNENSRSVIQYGYEYNYSSKNNEPKKICNIPKIFDGMLKKIKVFTGKKPDQCIVNMYLPGQGISKHIDSLVFDDYICCLSLGNDAVINFEHNGILKFVNVEKKSLYIMSGDSRYKWYHSINGKLTRSVRVSITFRNIK